MNDYTSTRRKGPSAKPVLVAVLASFLLGGAVAGYAVYSMTDRTPAATGNAPSKPQTLSSPASSPVPTPKATASQAAREAVQRVAEQQGGIDSRLAAAEQRLARLDLIIRLLSVFRKIYLYWVIPCEFTKLLPICLQMRVPTRQVVLLFR